MQDRVYCEKCKRFHVFVADLTDEEFNSFQFLSNRMATSQKYIKEGATPSVISAAMQLESDTYADLDKWWKEIAGKYGLKLDEHDYNVDLDHRKVHYNEN